MRRLKLQAQMTVDGFIAGPNGEMDFMAWNWSDDVKRYVNDLTAPVDCILLGRKLAEGFIPHWAGVAANPDDPDNESGRRFTDLPKVVFTRTLDKSVWNNAALVKGDLTEEINRLKKQDGKDLIVYGGAAFVSALIQSGLIDEYHLFINPVAIGNGMPIFRDLDHRQNLTLIKSKAFDCGIVVLHYEPKRD